MRLNLLDFVCYINRKARVGQEGSYNALYNGFLTDLNIL